MRSGEMIDVDIEKNLGTYLGDRQPLGRYASFDYCFNYFQSHQEEDRLDDLLNGDALLMSCLHLGFYLASWGMLRGKAELLKRSVRAYVPVVEALAGAPAHLWTLDVDRYDKTTIEEMRAFGKQLRATLHDRASDVLVTKVLLGTMGCVPAFDRYFNKGFGCSTFGPKALQRIGQFYREHADAIEAGRKRTLNFETGQPTERRYTQAKVIDMIFFVEGAR
ncbi:hypothetical protein A5787_23510 [Mycobacterium sp. 852002-50816_SCH5313054-b]|nr:hypothetical protein A5787_23510 [Mycobacterium sp. 852002-50816_SCH5313054-b]